MIDPKVVVMRLTTFCCSHGFSGTLIVKASKECYQIEVISFNFN